MFLLVGRPLRISAADCGSGEHDYAVTTREATEIEDGETIYTCQICGFTFRRILPATGHSWSEWITDKQPTCTGSGHKYRFCTKHANDQHTEEETIPALGHRFTEKITPPTCEEDGFKTYTCERCGDTYTEKNGEATGHHYTESITKEPDCEHVGEKTFTCVHCGDIYTEKNGEVTGHQYIESITKEPDCEHAGEKTFTCEHCGDTYTEKNGEATGHQYIESVSKEPDCEHGGEKTFSCKHCGDTYTETTPASGHSYSEWIVDKEPMEDEEGHRYKVCEHDSSHKIEEAVVKLSTVTSTKSDIAESTDSSTFPNTMDIALISITIVTAAGFGIAIRPDLYVLRWEKSESISFADWLKKNGYK